jgi:tetratricopeptide (TPR) repeat protein
VTYISPEFSEGVNGFGAKSRTALSSRVAQNTFSKFNFGARHTTVWPLDLQTNINFKSQLADKKLMPQEQFDLGGIDSVRGYTWGDFQGDNGVQANLEIIIPAYIIPKNMTIPYLCGKPLRDYFSGLVFFDYGYAEKRGLREDQGEKDNAQLMGVGAGIRVRLLNQGLIRMEWGIPVGDKPITEGAATKGRFHFSIDLEDHMPEEIERIQKTLAQENARYMAWSILDEELNKPDSPLRTRMDSYKMAAEEYYKNGDLDKAREYYAKVYTTGMSVYAQTENYVRKYADRKNELVKDRAIALQYYRNEEFEKSKEVWGRIINDAETKPLLLEF